MKNDTEVLHHLSLHDLHQDRIVGGIAVNISNYPYQVSLRHVRKDSKFSAHFCGASIIGRRTILTAAHCIYGQKNLPSVQVFVGCERITDTGCKGQAIERCKVHEKYNVDTIENDIAVCVLKQPLEYSPDIAPIQIAKDSSTKESEVCVVSGWGTLKEGGRLPEDGELRSVEVPITSDSYCQKRYGKENIKPSMICAGLPQGEKDSCQGDSGGPLKHVKTGELWGVVSWGYGCARPAFPGVYTRVAYYHKWIKANTL